MAACFLQLPLWAALGTLWGLETGMIGTSVASEKTGKALVEESSPSTTPKTGGKSFLDYLGLW